jgi:alpha-galactosidase
MFIAQNKKKAFVVYVDILAEPNLSFKRLKLDGLDSNTKGKEKKRYILEMS